MTLHREHIRARLERGLRGGGDFERPVIAREAAELRGEDAVQGNLRVLVVMDVKLERRQIPSFRQGDLRADVNVRRVPLRADDGAGRSLGTEPAGALLPPAVIEIRARPAVGGTIGRVSPDDAVGLRPRLDDFYF